MKDLKKIVWDERAVAQFEKICNYIVEQSPQNADNLKSEIIHTLEKIPANPEKHPADKYRNKNKGDYRAFELHHVRIAYQITAEHILILRIRSTHQEPKTY